MVCVDSGTGVGCPGSLSKVIVLLLAYIYIYICYTTATELRALYLASMRTNLNLVFTDVYFSRLGLLFSELFVFMSHSFEFLRIARYKCTSL